MRKDYRLIAAAAVLAGLAAAARPQSTKEIMRMKLDHAQEILEAVALAEFSAVEEHASELEWLAEASSWFVLSTEEYARHSAEFRRAAGALAEAGKNRDLDASANRFAEMTMRCIACHEYLRAVRGEKDGSPAR